MEVQKHPHHVTHKKKWFEYLLEFFMLFLAVFLGFTAENIREGNLEKHGEKEYITSYIQNLEKDTAALTDFNQRNKMRILFLDSLLTLKKTDLTLPENCRKFYYYYLRTMYYPNFTTSDATITQLKNSGNLRLIRNRQVTDSILNYDRINKIISERADMLNTRINRTWEAANLIMNISIQSDTSYYIHEKRMLIKQPPPLINDLEKQRTFFNCVSEEIRINAAYLRFLIDLRTKAEDYLRFIKKEYQLENE